MNTTQLLNKLIYPSAYSNARRKSFPIFDTVTLAAATIEYFFFVTQLGNIFRRNKTLPLAGSEIYLVDGISMYLNTTINTTALIDSLNELLQQSYLLISVNDRQVAKLPGLDFLQYTISLNGDATPEILLSTKQQAFRKLPIPIFMNSQSAFEFKFVTTTAAATAFNGLDLRLSLHGIQVDKLDSFYYDALKDNKFEQIAVSYYDTVAIANGNETTYQLFANANKSKNLYSQVFPLNARSAMQVQNIEVFFNQPDVPIVPETIYQSRMQNILRISVDDVEFYSGNLQDSMSVVAGFAGNLTTAGADTLAYSRYLNFRQSMTLRTPLSLPASGNIQVALIQPAGSLGVTGEITCVLRGVETRGLA